MAEAGRYDVIIIGTGAGGGTLLSALAPSGKKILVLERGDFVPRERENWDCCAVNVEGRYQTKDVWKDKDGNDLHPHTNYAVGGNTKFYGAALFRLRKEDLGVLPHHDGVSPAWPISYEDLEPYYTQAERLYQVHGTRLGSVGVIVMDETVDMVWALENLLAFYSHESCGQCTPCREGSDWALDVVRRIRRGFGRPQDLETLERIARFASQGMTICPLGDAFCEPIKSFLKHFGHEFQAAIAAARPLPAAKTPVLPLRSGHGWYGS